MQSITDAAVAGTDISRMVSRLDVVVVIACLGAGVVIAVPHHVQQLSEVRRAEVIALERTLDTATRLAHTRWLRAGQPATLPGERGLVAMNSGYPSPSTVPLLLAEPETAAFVFSAGTWQHRAASRGSCGVQYAPPAAGESTPLLHTLADGC